MIEKHALGEQSRSDEEKKENAEERKNNPFLEEDVRLLLTT